MWVSGAAWAAEPDLAWYASAENLPRIGDLDVHLPVAPPDTGRFNVISVARSTHQPGSVVALAIDAESPSSEALALVARVAPWATVVAVLDPDRPLTPPPLPADVLTTARQICGGGTDAMQREFDALCHLGTVHGPEWIALGGWDALVRRCPEASAHLAGVVAVVGGGPDCAPAEPRVLRRLSPAPLAPAEATTWGEAWPALAVEPPEEPRHEPPPGPRVFVFHHSACSEPTRCRALIATAACASTR
ncbi:MAG: hypothetical protein ABMA64_25180 [Myxococcota bacterium]